MEAPLFCSRLVFSLCVAAIPDPRRPCLAPPPWPHPTAAPRALLLRTQGRRALLPPVARACAQQARAWACAAPLPRRIACWSFVCHALVNHLDRGSKRQKMMHLAT
jgi:hypothetical protein